MTQSPAHFLPDRHSRITVTVHSIPGPPPPLRSTPSTSPACGACSRTANAERPRRGAARRNRSSPGREASRERLGEGGAGARESACVGPDGPPKTTRSIRRPRGPRSHGGAKDLRQGRPLPTSPTALPRLGEARGGNGARPASSVNFAGGALTAARKRRRPLGRRRDLRPSPGRQAASAALRRRARSAAPRPPKPVSIRAQLAGSGTPPGPASPVRIRDRLSA
jgi:hypothetical protein